MFVTTHNKGSCIFKIIYLTFQFWALKFDNTHKNVHQNLRRFLLGGWSVDKNYEFRHARSRGEGAWPRKITIININKILSKQNENITLQTPNHENCKKKTKERMGRWKGEGKQRKRRWGRRKENKEKRGKDRRWVISKEEERRKKTRWERRGWLNKDRWYGEENKMGKKRVNEQR